MVNWEKLWQDFNDWCDLPRRTSCKTCGHVDLNDPEWPDQQDQIEKLVEEQLCKQSKS